MMKAKVKKPEGKDLPQTNMKTMTGKMKTANAGMKKPKIKGQK